MMLMHGALLGTFGTGIWNVEQELELGVWALSGKMTRSIGAWPSRYNADSIQFHPLVLVFGPDLMVTKEGERKSHESRRANGMHSKSPILDGRMRYVIYHGISRGVFIPG